MSVFKIGEIRYLYSDEYNPFDDEYDMTHIIYSTDWHFGKKGKFRSDDMDKALFEKLDRKSNYKRMIDSPNVVELCGGDICDTPKINQAFDYNFRSMDIHTLSRLTKHLIQEDIQFIIGNHDIKHETNWEECVKHSPLPILNVDLKTKLNYETKDNKKIQVLMKHWKPDYSNDDLKFDENCDIKIKMTHEPLVMGSVPFNVVQMESYPTDADIVLCADIHTHYGVNKFNNTIFISTGSMTRTRSDERDKKPYFAHIRILNNIVNVDFIHFLPKEDDPNKYWVDVRKKELKDKEKQQIDRNVGKIAREIIEDESTIEEESLNNILIKVAKKEELSEKDIENLILI